MALNESESIQLDTNNLGEFDIKAKTYWDNIKLLFLENSYQNIKQLFTDENNKNIEEHFKKLENSSDNLELNHFYQFFKMFEASRKKVATQLQNPSFFQKINQFIDDKTYKIENLLDLKQGEWPFHLFYISIGMVIGVLSFGASLALFQMPLLPALISGALNIVFFIIPTYIRRYHFYQSPEDSKALESMMVSLEQNYKDLQTHLEL